VPAEFFSPANRSATDLKPCQTTTDLDEALRRANGNRTEAAKLMGISRRTFYRRLE